jgi:hypothetical protein
MIDFVSQIPSGLNPISIKLYMKICIYKLVTKSKVFLFLVLWHSKGALRRFDTESLLIESPIL